MVDVALDSMKKVLWVFGPVMCVHYPLYEIEGDENNEWGPGRRWGANQRGTALQVIERCEAQELLHINVIWKLLEDKWAHFGQPIFFW